MRGPWQADENHCTFILSLHVRAVFRRMAMVPQVHVIAFWVVNYSLQVNTIAPRVCWIGPMLRERRFPHARHTANHRYQQEGVHEHHTRGTAIDYSGY
jgi:hypothetical protein